MSAPPRPAEAGASAERGKPSAPPPARRPQLQPVLLPVVSLVVFLVLWQLAAASGTWNETFVPYPSTVWRAFLDVSTTHDGTRGYQGYLLWEHLNMTLRRVLAGVVLGVLFGVIVGLLMGTVGWGGSAGCSSRGSPSCGLSRRWPTSSCS